jgi:addiction module HigA family antidote
MARVANTSRVTPQNTRTATMRLPTNRPPTHPGEMLLEEFLIPLGVSQAHFATAIGVSCLRLNDIVHGKRAITVDTALRLERALGMGADFWLRLQLAWDLWHAERSPDARAIASITPLPQLAQTSTPSPRANRKTSRAHGR